MLTHSILIKSMNDVQFVVKTQVSPISFYWQSKQNVPCKTFIFQKFVKIHMKKTINPVTNLVLSIIKKYTPSLLIPHISSSSLFINSFQRQLFPTIKSLGPASPLCNRKKYPDNISKKWLSGSERSRKSCFICSLSFS